MEGELRKNEAQAVFCTRVGALPKFVMHCSFWANTRVSEVPKMG